MALRGEKTDAFNYKELYIDLDKDIDGDEQICVLEKSENSISFYDLMNEKTSILIKKFDSNIFENKIEPLQEHIKSYDFSIIEIENLPLEKIADIFTRINTSGKALTLFEIMNAKIYTEEKDGQNGFDLEEKFNALISELEKVGYETIKENKSLLLQLISLAINQNAKKEAILKIAKDKFIAEWENATKSLKLAIDFARNSLKIPVSKLLPYSALLILTAYFFRINNYKQPTKKQIENLSRYFFRSAFTQRFNSASDTKMNADIKLIEKIKNDENININNELPFSMGKDELVDWIKQDFSTSNAFDKGVLCILASIKPRNFQNSIEVTLDNSNLSIATSKNYHHFFPKAYLKRKKQDEFANALANITLIDDSLNKNISDKSPSKYIKEFQDENPNLKEDLKTHLIDLDSFGIWDDNYDAFLQKRAEKIADEILKRI